MALTTAQRAALVSVRDQGHTGAAAPATVKSLKDRRLISEPDHNGRLNVTPAGTKELAS